MHYMHILCRHMQRTHLNRGCALESGLLRHRYLYRLRAGAGVAGVVAVVVVGEQHLAVP